MPAHVIHVYMDDDSSLSIESFGPHTIVGAVEDILNGEYTPFGRKVESITIDINRHTPISQLAPIVQLRATP